MDENPTVGAKNYLSWVEVPRRHRSSHLGVIGQHPRQEDKASIKSGSSGIAGHRTCGSHCK
eukprot:3498794-Amphidinium_carterae.1